MWRDIYHTIKCFLWPRLRWPWPSRELIPSHLLSQLFTTHFGVAVLFLFFLQFCYSLILVQHLSFCIFQEKDEKERKRHKSQSEEVIYDFVWYCWENRSYMNEWMNSYSFKIDLSVLDQYLILCMEINLLAWN